MICQVNYVFPVRASSFLPRDSKVPWLSGRGAPFKVNKIAEWHFRNSICQSNISFWKRHNKPFIHLLGKWSSPACKVRGFSAAWAKFLRSSYPLCSAIPFRVHPAYSSRGLLRRRIKRVMGPRKNH